MARCRECSAELRIGENWTEARQRRHNYICGDCARAYAKAHYSENKHDYQAARSNWYDANKGQIAAKAKADRENRPEIFADRARRHYEKHRDQLLAYQRTYDRDHRDVKKAAKDQRRYREQAYAEGADKNLIAEFYRLSRSLTQRFGVAYHVDHIVPLSKGGTHHQDNLVVMRGDLNLKKGAQFWPSLAWFASSEESNG